MLRIAILDDDKFFIKKVCKIIDMISSLDEIDYRIFCFLNESSFFKACDEIYFDIILLDIELPNIDGIRIGERLREDKNNSIIIYVTAHKEYMIKSFGLNVFGFIIKDEIDTKLEYVLNKLIKYLLDKRLIYFKTEDGIFYVEVKEILYFRYSNRKIYLCIEKEKERIIYEHSLKSIIKKYNLINFVQPNSQYLVNLKHIKNITNKILEIADKNKFISITPRRVKYIMKCFQEYNLKFNDDY